MRRYTSFRNLRPLLLHGIFSLLLPHKAKSTTFLRAYTSKQISHQKQFLTSLLLFGKHNPVPLMNSFIDAIKALGVWYL